MAAGAVDLNRGTDAAVVRRSSNFHRCAVTLSPARLQELRRDACKTRRSVARRIGASPALIRRYERGEAMCPTAHRKALAELFGVSVPYLMGWTIGGDA